MPNFDVTVIKVFGASAVNKITVEAKDKYEARELAKDADWTSIYNSMTQNNLTDSYEFAEIAVDGEVIESTKFNAELLNEAVSMLKEEVINE